MRIAKIAKRVLAPIIAVACVWAIASALRGQTVESIGAAFEAIPAVALVTAITLLAVNFTVLWAMETLALRDAGVGLSLRRSAISAFVGNALSVAAGLGPISGAGVRAGLFRQWGLPAQAAAATALSATLMSLSGGATLAAVGLTLQPDGVAAIFGAPPVLIRGCGIAFLVVAVGALIAAGRDRSAFSVLGVNMSAPSAAGGLLRLGLGALDWFISANVFFAFLSPEDGWAPLSFVATFATAHFAGMAAGAPAGLGVFDALMLHAGAFQLSTAEIAAALLLYRLVGYVTPALLALGPYLAMSQRAAVVR